MQEDAFNKAMDYAMQNRKEGEFKITNEESASLKKAFKKPELGNIVYGSTLSTSQKQQDVTTHVNYLELIIVTQRIRPKKTHSSIFSE